MTGGRNNFGPTVQTIGAVSLSLSRSCDIPMMLIRTCRVPALRERLLQHCQSARVLFQIVKDYKCCSAELYRGRSARKSLEERKAEIERETERAKRRR